ncbi:MAG: Ig-like domain-containing protein, partial [Gammaproteobacteria bacterium]
MMKSMKSLQVFALAFGCALLLSACGGGGNSNNPKPPPPAPQPSAAKSTITAAPTTVTADGKSTAAITVTLRDNDGNPFTGAAEVDINANPCSNCALHYTNDNGKISGTLSSGAAADIVLSFTVNGTASPSKATVHFVVPSSPVTAHADIPDSVNAGATFSADVSLTAANPPGSAASVQIVDVGTVTPQINCGQSQSIAINGASAGFSCQAPAVTLGEDNTHELQVDVNGTPGLKLPVAVQVVNGGQVDVQLTSAAGTAITATAPGQTIDVAFSTKSNPLGVGDYTITAPSGWQVANNGVCNINSSTTSCKVAVNVPGTAANGLYDIKIAPEGGSSPLSTDTLPIHVQSTPPTPANDLVFDLAQNISDTLYAAPSGTAPTSTYVPVFLFKNTSGNSLTIDNGKLAVNGLANLQYACNVTPNTGATYALSPATAGSPSCSLPNGDLYAVSGTLNNSFAPSPATVSGTRSISIDIEGGGKTYVQYDRNVTFVKYVPGHIALRVVNTNRPDVVHVAADAVNYADPNGAIMINFGSTGIGTFSTDSVAKVGTYDKALGTGGGVIYIPYNASSGAVYLARGANGFKGVTGAPTPTGGQQGLPPYLQIELTYRPEVSTLGP